MSAKSRKSKTQCQVYIGPTIQHVVVEGTIFNNGLPEALKEKIQEKPLIGGLLVPIDGLADARKEIRQTGSALNILYEEARKA